MQTITVNTGRVGVLMALLILFQSCRVYRQKTVSLEDAVESGKRVRIKTYDGRTLKFKEIIFKDGEFFGVKNKYSGIEITPLNPSELVKIQPKNEILSLIVSGAVVYASLFAALFVGYAITGGISFGL